ncbi:glycoside hydrolase family 47 protein [Gonapodya prolifera JEL478]|uniref:alpha-1,2-Mannosidase n=1 Tax=Gonapodya prolifera (strain JEL478) TaxID=1344416 RepID=A0A139ACE1_GONPJ|nr:glycoside hydrolase family 47 protein [Gonapodya prolifera JEL478]|eukprot:KXS14482.1 glycoside hydrolase family 47 protein [Gonapodya prolifera JEL478]
MSSPSRAGSSPDRVALLREEKAEKAARTAYLDRMNQITQGLSIATNLASQWPWHSQKMALPVQSNSSAGSEEAASPRSASLRERRNRVLRFRIILGALAVAALVAAPWLFQGRFNAMLGSRIKMGGDRLPRDDQTSTFNSIVDASLESDLNRVEEIPTRVIWQNGPLSDSTGDLRFTGQEANSNPNENGPPVRTDEIGQGRPIPSQERAPDAKEMNRILEDEDSHKFSANTKKQASPKASRDDEMLDFVRDMIRHAWRGYHTYASAHDDLAPIAHTGRNWYPAGSLYNTPVDSLDTLWIAGLEKEYEEARVLVKKANWDVDASVSFFETTIRQLGGLLSAHSLTQDPLYLNLSHSLGLRLLKAVDPSSGLAGGAINLHTGAHVAHDWLQGMVGTAETGTYALEFAYLGKWTEDERFTGAVKDLSRTMEKLRGTTPVPGVWSDRIDPRGLNVVHTGRYGVGGGIDSFYEYLLKIWVWAGGPGGEADVNTDTAWAQVWRDMYEESVDAMLSHNGVNHTRPNGESVAFLTSWHHPSGGHDSTMEHLACFIPGMFVLGIMTAPEKLKDTHREAKILSWAKGVAESCVRMYSEGPLGLASDLVEMTGETLRPAGWGTSYHTRYILRPETLESLFLLWRHTHDPIYRQWARGILLSIERECRIETGGYAGIANVGVGNRGERHGREWNDMQESFLIAETLKYGYLIFEEDDVVRLDEWVFNTEAHPLRIPKWT